MDEFQLDFCGRIKVWDFDDQIPSLCKNVRRHLQDIKPGHPIMVRDFDGVAWQIAFLVKLNHGKDFPVKVARLFDQDGIPHGETTWKQFKLLLGYDYSQPPPIKAGNYNNSKSKEYNCRMKAYKNKTIDECGLTLEEFQHQPGCSALG